MASHICLEPPVRILLRTRRVDLANVRSSVEEADTELITQFCRQYGIDTANTQHLITRLDRKQVDILFDYGVPTDDRQPEVAAFKVRVKDKDSVPGIEQLLNPVIRAIVNTTVDVWKTELRESKINFPRRTDIEKIRRALATVASVSVIHENNWPKY